MDQKQPLQILREELAKDEDERVSNDTLLTLVDKCEPIPNVLITKAIILIKIDKYSEALNILKTIKDHQLYQFTKLYALYKDSQYAQVINEAKENVPTELLIAAQSFQKSEQFVKAIESYQKLLKDNSFPGDAEDILTNIANSAIQLNDVNLLKQINQQIYDFVKKQKNNYRRDLLLNHSLINLALNDLKVAKELIIRFENLVKLEKEREEDLIFSQLVLDLLENTNYQAKVTHYETFENHSQQGVILNNLAVYQERLHPHHDTLKRIEEAIASNYKFTPQQVNTLKMNRAIIQIIKNRPVKDHGLPESLLIAVNKAKWETQITDLNNFLIFAIHNENSQRILELFNVPNWIQSRVLVIFILGHLMKVDETKFPHLINPIGQKWRKLLCQFYIKKSNLDKALEFYEDDEQLKGQIGHLCIEKGQVQKGAKFIDSIDYRPIEDMTIIENLLENVGLSKKVVETTEKKIQKKKKKRVRYPKGFDKANPGPPPNPERWLAKQERKEWKKKKQIKSRTQGAGLAGKETMNTFQNQGASTANLEATKRKTRRGK